MTGGRSAFALSTHASYGCRERGACCTAGWPIPVERENLDLVEEARRDGRIEWPVHAIPLFREIPDAPDGAAALLEIHDGGCVFHRQTGSGRCGIHRALGHAALPLACRQFPRVSVQDPRGTSITLSHYCPTAAELLDAPGPIQIVENNAGFPSDGEYVGLDVRESMPPLLRPGMLMDWESWWMFEREAIALIDKSWSPAEALARLSSAVEFLRTWRPANRPLKLHVSEAIETASTLAPAHSGQPWPNATSVVRDAIPTELRPPEPPSKIPTLRPERRLRYLAAHAFANWTAHLGQGLRTWLKSIEAADALIEHGMGVAHADLWLRHLVDPRVFAERLSAAE